MKCYFHHLDSSPLVFCQDKNNNDPLQTLVVEDNSNITNRLVEVCRFEGSYDKIDSSRFMPASK